MMEFHPDGVQTEQESRTTRLPPRLPRLQTIILLMEHTLFEEFRSDLSSQQDECEHQKMEATNSRPAPLSLGTTGLLAGSPSPKC